MHGFRLLQRHCMPCGASSPPVAVDDDGRPLRYRCTEPVHHTSQHLARLDGQVLWRWPNRAPSPAR